MRRIPEIYATEEFGLSIEIFPPKTEAGDVALFEHLGRLRSFDPAFISCTCPLVQASLRPRPAAPPPSSLAA